MPSPRRLITTGSPFEKTMAYSRAVVQGDWCFISGVTGYDYRAMRMPGTVEDQTQNCFDTIASVLDAAGFEMADIARVQYTVVDRGLVADVQPILEQRLGEIRPAATMVIAGLIEDAMLIEIEVTAFRG